MLGVILLYVGIVLISNGLYRLYELKDQSLVVMNYFTGGLGLILNIGSILIGVSTGKTNEWFYGSATGLLFAFTYLYTAINKTFNLDQRLYGWYSLFVSINAIPAGFLCLYGYGGNTLYGLIWWLWGFLWLTGFIENILGKNLGKLVGYISIIEGIITAWIPGMLMLLGLWP
ncbi:AmiS/UreI family transporter [Enterococcus hirae]|uniref:AmiS/UreI family transporter n=1 Tax=Enterococcus TaxID=1350 RepID=UPI0015F291B3|nr:AmiS/UreI family transporter [Enterococcus hirae]MBA5252618.1 acid-activated urea channel [Enterococcus hirae]MBS6193049.1 AmiS/UreI family transporter [Enterococcus hirae]MDU1571293.1 AmiS/UreI family transporter [Enterococcus hirae]MDU4894794.1 AmiS/UreI family transporter [Enterococcus hirae]